MGVRQEEFSIKVGTGIIRAFERIDIENHQIFSEFIDNSLQSFMDHFEILKNKLHVKRCEINIEWTNNEIIISDNAFGMNSEEFSRAIRLNAPAVSYSKNSLSKYGIGLKYAAANLGDEWTIESTAYGSKDRFLATIDIDEWKSRNPETMPVNIDDDYDEQKHYTVITIKRLKHSFNVNDMNKVIKLLGIIYSHFIDYDKILQISVNGEIVKYSEPELYKNPYGQEVMETFTKSFIFEGKKYEFTGWIGVLKTGATQDAGLCLMQNHRVIELNYRPNKIFGGGNTFKYQRIVGNVEFVGESWEVRVNKDGLAWKSNGLQEKFLDELKNLEQVKKVIKEANERRVRDNPTRKVTQSVINANIDGLKNQYSIGEKACFTVLPKVGYSIKSVKVQNLDLKPIELNSYEFVINSELPNNITVKVVCSESKVLPVQPMVVPEPNGDVKVTIKDFSKKNNVSRKTKIEEDFKFLEKVSIPGNTVKKEPNILEEGIVISFENTKFSFDIEEITDSSVLDWIDLKEISHPKENSYRITINYCIGFLKNIILNDDEKDMLIKLCISICLSRIISTNYGLQLDKSSILIKQLNSILSKTGYK